MKLFLPVSVALVACGVNASVRSASRRLSFEKIGSYEPLSRVTDHNAIDLDQKAMESQLGLATDSSYTKAKEIYEKGAHSKSIAEVTITGGAPGKIPAGTEVKGKTASGDEVRGKTEGEVASGASTLRIQYATTDIQDQYVNCQVGALGAAGNTDGCFANSGSLEITGFGDAVAYTYTATENNVNGRTLAGFSKEAEEKMGKCANCPYVDYKKFYDYYGVYDYAHQWVLAAFSKGKTSFTNGNADFGVYGFDGRTEVIKKGTAYMNVWMYVIREFEDALDDCKIGCIDCNDDPVHAWDEGVAFYTGSQQEAGASTDGYLLYALANKRCQNFKTCGENGDSTEGLAKINSELFNLFDIGQRNLAAGKCDDAKVQKERIAQLMAVPLVQGTIRYAYLTDIEFSPNVSEKARAEGAVFAASVLPVVNACSVEDAKIIYDNMKVGSSATDFRAVKRAFERNYGCMGISGADVGGLYDSVNGSYFTEAAPSGTGNSSSGGLSGGAIAGIVIAAVVVVAIIGFLIFKNKKSGDIDTTYSNGHGHSAKSANGANTGVVDDNVA